MSVFLLAAATAPVAIHPALLVSAFVAIVVGILGIGGIGAKMVRSQSRVEFNGVAQGKQLTRIESKVDKESERLTDVDKRLGIVEVKVDTFAKQTQTQHSENITGMWAQSEQSNVLLKYLADTAIAAALASQPPKEKP